MIRFLNILLLLLIISFGCSGPQNWEKPKFEGGKIVIEFENKITIEQIKQQQFIVRNLIDNCETFGCWSLEDEKQILFDYIFDRVSPIVQGVQQSIVTSITRRCNKSDDSTSCVEYDKEMKKLKAFLEKYIEQDEI